MDLDKAIGERIANERTRLGLKQREVAEAVGLTTGQVGKMEVGLRKLTIPILALLHDKLNMSIGYLVTGESSELVKQDSSITAIEKVKKLQDELIKKDEEINWLKEHARDLAFILKSQSDPDVDTSKPIKKGRRQKNTA
ncbi:helix-turn-helix transcriptional regulator [uncultured Microscilla sp.]|uniref:helix-turn-helix domain-containing protein n=1 Tax=uncultured Microscilla sp. TaxID=432653 RepID=UPI002634A7F4|nr:helix-turn-helix transcriptional regulator [uncultured Microscilla sp.]